MTTLRIEWDYDEEDATQRKAQSAVFFAAWINQFGVIEWTCTDESEFMPLVEQMHGQSDS